MALEGTLHDFSLADIFQLIGLQRKTGILTLTGPEDTVSVLFETGRIVGAESEAKHLEDRLGHVLLKTGKLSTEQLNRFLRIQRETGQRLGTILLEQEAITRSDLIRALQLQVSQILFRLFRWGDGHYHFAQSGQVDYDRHCFEPIPVEDVLMEGLRILDEWPLIEKRVRSFSLVYVQVDPRRRVEAGLDEGHDTGHELDLLLGVDDGEHEAPRVEAPVEDGRETVTVSPQEEVVYRLVNRRFMVQDIIDRSELGEFETCKALFQLLEKDLIKEARSGRSDAPAHRAVGDRADRALAFVLAVTLVGIGLAGVWASLTVVDGSPARRALAPFSPEDALERLGLATSQNRLARLEYALRVFALHRGRFPESLDELRTAGLVTDADLVDPWGARYGYVVTRRSFQLRGVDPDGQARPGLILTGRIEELAENAAPRQGWLFP